MLTTEFSKRGLESLLRPSDVVHYPFARTQHHRSHYLSTIASRIQLGAFDFSRLRAKSIRSFKAYRTQKLGDELVLRRLAEIVQTAYRVRQADRTGIVSQIRILLEEATPKQVLRLDIATFFESISRDEIIRILKRDRIVSLHAIGLLQKFFESLKPVLFDGVPRGLSISAALSELYLSSLDNAIRRISGVYYYARYVDDIIVFSTEDVEVLKEEIRSLMPPGMHFNESKCNSFFVGCRCEKSCSHVPANCVCATKCKCKLDTSRIHQLEYVGYALSFPDVPVNDNKNIQTGMAQRKLKRLKTRMVLAVLDHVRNPNFGLLEKRFTFLAENQRLRRAESKGRLKAGIYYNYPLITDKGSLEELNSFMRNLIHAANGSFGSRVHASLTPVQRDILQRLSFVSGFERRRSRRWTSGVVGAIRRCWNHV